MQNRRKPNKQLDKTKEETVTKVHNAKEAYSWGRVRHLCDCKNSRQQQIRVSPNAIDNKHARMEMFLFPHQTFPHDEKETIYLLLTFVFFSVCVRELRGSDDLAVWAAERIRLTSADAGVTSIRLEPTSRPSSRGSGPPPPPSLLSLL